MKKLVLLFFLFSSLSFDLWSQIPSITPYNGVIPAVFNSAGGTYDDPNSYYRYEWSFGELLVIDAFAPPDSSVLVTHGVLQPCTDKINASPLTLFFEKGHYRIFPNPTAGKFELNFFVKESGRMSLQLIDASGRIIEKRSYQYNGCCRIELFDLSAHPNGIYYVIADLKPDRLRGGDNLEVIRRSGLKVVKITQ